MPTIMMPASATIGLLLLLPVSYDVQPRPLDIIPPGTVIGKEPPRGWSHLIIKSQPRAAAGDIDKVSSTALHYAGLFFTSILAHVESVADVPRRYRLARVAVGVGTRIKEQDVIVTPETQEKLGAALGLVGRAVLVRTQDKLQQMQAVVRSETLMIFDAPAVLVHEGSHRAVVLRYALLLDAPTGQLETLLWWIDHPESPMKRKAVNPLQWLPPNQIEDCVLRVDAAEFTLGVPSERAFAMNRMVQGHKQLTLSETARPLAGAARFTSAQAADLDAYLRAMLKMAQ